MPAWADLVIGPAGSTSSPGGAAAGGTACRRGPANKTVVRRPRPPASPGGVCLEGSSRMETRCTVRQQGRANYQHEMQGYKKSMMSNGASTVLPLSSGLCASRRSLVCPGCQGMPPAAWCFPVVCVLEEEHLLPKLQVIAAVHVHVVEPRRLEFFVQFMLSFGHLIMFSSNDPYPLER
ncbi:hypothetical protein BS78_K248600 [Paspalum vaginatum]|uniref:Uncharacterized protein n=1 Tax=Paspalum vaginatum TaxID=158149 RepID=A0A9W7XE56_9POAL|nr:hypothetical protein BS78_K248600 [Paspalum vaginatum]KAJ1256983.1 hypothetical protein BS78_K248600 [Paspalum vaginatum]